MIRASLIQCDARPLDKDRNRRSMIGLANRAASAGSNLILFPELANTGYVEPLTPGHTFTTRAEHYGQDLYDACADIGDDLTTELETLARDHGCHLVVGLGLRDPRRAGVMTNSSLLFGPEGLAGIYTKVHQWQNEKLWFTKGTHLDCFPALGTTLGMQICYDIRFPEITRAFALQGATIVTSIWASFGPAGTPVRDEGLFIHRAYTRAIENGVFFLSCNRSGMHGDQRFFGRSCALAPDGRVLGALDHDREGILEVEIDLAEVARYRSSTGIWADRDPALYARYLAIGA